MITSIEKAVMNLIINENVKIKYKTRKSVSYSLLNVDNIEINERIENKVPFISIEKGCELEMNIQNHEENEINIYLIENTILFNFTNIDIHYAINHLEQDYIDLIKKSTSLKICVLKQNHIDYYFIFDKIIGR